MEIINLVGRFCRWLVCWGMVMMGIMAWSTPFAWAESGDALANSAQNPFQVGISAFEQGDYQRAAEAFTKAIERTPQSAGAYSNRCLAYLSLDNTQAAIADCTSAIEIEPRNPESYLNRGLAHYRLEQYAEAIADYNQLLTIQPYDYRAHYNRGLAQFALGEYRQALIDYGEALRQIQPLDWNTMAVVHNDRGLAQFQLANYQAALNDFSRTIQLNATDVRAYFNRACVYHHRGDNSLALQDFTQVIRLVPEHAEAYLNRGLIYQQLGNRTAAIADLQQASHYFQSQGATISYQTTLNFLKRLQSNHIAWG